MAKEKFDLSRYLKKMLRDWRLRKEINFYYAALSFPNDSKENNELKARVTTLKAKLDEYFKDSYKSKFTIINELQPSAYDSTEFIDNECDILQELHEEVLILAKELLEIRFENNFKKFNARK